MPSLVVGYGHAEPVEALGEPIPAEVTAAIDALAARRPDSLSVPEIREAREAALRRR